MISPIRLIRPAPNPGARERTLERISEFNKARDNVIKVCREKQLNIPEMVC